MHSFLGRRRGPSKGGPVLRDGFQPYWWFEGWRNYSEVHVGVARLVTLVSPMEATARSVSCSVFKVLMGTGDSGPAG